MAGGSPPAIARKEQNVNRNVRFAVMALLGLSLPMWAQQPGQANYNAKCAMCHGSDGAGNTPAGKAMKVRSLKSPEDVKATDAELFRDTKNGIGRMHGYAGKLTDAQIQEVVAYIRALQK